MLALRARSAAALLLAFASAAAPGPARCDGTVDGAIEALRKDPSIKVRTQAALVIGQRGPAARAALPALAEALEHDPGPAVRLAAARALGRVGDPVVRAALERSARGDPDEAVRTASIAALAAIAAAPRARPASFALQEPQGHAEAADRRAFKEALVRHLARRGFALADDGEVMLKPSVLGVDVAVHGGTTVIAVRAGLVAVEPGGRMAAMLESGARLSAKGSIPEGKLPAYAARALDAAARTLSEDLAAKLGER
jgi:HEAT repeats